MFTSTLRRLLPSGRGNPHRKGNRDHCSAVDMAAKRRKGKSTVREGQLLGEEGRKASPHRHWVSGTKQHSGMTVMMLPLSCQSGFSYISTKIKELGQTTYPPVEERWAWGLGWPGHRNCYPWKQSLGDWKIDVVEESLPQWDAGSRGRCCCPGPVHHSTVSPVRHLPSGNHWNAWHQEGSHFRLQLARDPTGWAIWRHRKTNPTLVAN